MTDYPVAVNDDDFFDVNSVPTTGTATLTAGYNNAISQISRAYLNVDTSGIPDTDVITAATFYFYASAYVSSKGVTKTYNLLIWNGSTYVTIKTGTWSSAGWISEVLTSGELAYINKTGTTNFFITIDNPGGTNYRTMTITAKESGTNTAYLAVTHAAPSTYSPQIITLCS